MWGLFYFTFPKLELYFYRCPCLLTWRNLSLVSFFSHFILEGVFLSKASLDVAFPCISVETFVTACSLQPLSPTHQALLSSRYFQWMGLKTMYSCMKLSKTEIKKKKIVIRLPWWDFFSLQTGKQWLPSHSVAVPMPALQRSKWLTDTNYPPFSPFQRLSRLVLSLLLTALLMTCPKIP